MRIDEINARIAAIGSEIENANGDALTALETELNTLIEERSKIEAEEAKKAQIRVAVAAGAKEVKVLGDNVKATQIDETEERAKKFVESNKMTIDMTEARSTLISGGTIATPSKVSGIFDAGTQVSSIVDMVYVDDCTGMGSDIVAYEVSTPAGATQTEGSAGTSQDTVFGKVTIQPTSYAVVSKISKQVRRQSPLQYEEKVKRGALTGLRKQASAAIISAIKASALTQTVAADVANSKGKIGADTLRKLVLSYGTNEEVAGQAVLILNKSDLIAFGAVRGTNEKKAVYEITPDAANPNTGIIKEGGLAVRYVLNANVTACDNTTQTNAAIKTMIYGNPLNCKLDLFSPYEINVSEDHDIDKLLLTVVGDVELGCDVVVSNGFAILTIPAAS